MKRCVAFAALAAFASSGCLVIDGMTYMIDVAAKTGHIVVHDIGSNESSFTDDPGAPVVKDFDELLSDYVAGDALTGAAGHFGFRAWTVGAHQLVDAGTRLDGELDFTFAGPDDLRIVAYDRAHPLTWCPPDDFTVTAANATFRTPDGCLVWAAGTRVLRIELRTTRTEPATSLLPLWRKR